MCVFWKPLFQILFPQNNFPSHLFSWQYLNDRKVLGYRGEYMSRKYTVFTVFFIGPERGSTHHTTTTTTKSLTIQVPRK